MNLLKSELKKTLQRLKNMQLVFYAHYYTAYYSLIIMATVFADCEESGSKLKQK